jgi:hypothetical protein
MGVISTATLDNFTSSAQIDASTVITAFDTIYDVVNGGLDSANIVSTFTINSSQVVIEDSNNYISATNATNIGTNLVYKGWNSIHTSAFGSEGFAVFPGMIEIDGQYCRINSRMTFAGFFNDGFKINLTSTSKLWGLSMRQAPVLTASDMLFAEFTGTDTFNYDVAKNGWYLTDSASVSRRLLCTMRVDFTGTQRQRYYDDEFFQRPNIGHRYELASSEAQALGFVESATDDICSVVQVFDMDTYRYGYEIKGLTPTTTGCNVVLLLADWRFGEPTVTQSTLGFEQAISGSVQYHFYVDTVAIINSGGGDRGFDTEIIGGGGMIPDTSGISVVRGVGFSFKSNNINIVVNGGAPSVFTSQPFYANIKRKMDVDRRI